MSKYLIVNSYFNNGIGLNFEYDAMIIKLFNLKRNRFFSFIIIYNLILSSLIGLMVFDGVMNESRVKAAIIIVDYNGDGDYTKIQDAVDNANNGDTIYVWEGTYNENLVLDKKLSLIGNGTINTTINGGGIDDVVLITADNINISGFAIINSGSADAGIQLEFVRNCKINNNNISNNNNGISLYQSPNNNISGNKISKSNNNGISLRDSSNINIMNNIVITSKGYGCINVNSSNIILTGNNFSMSDYHGIDIRLSSKNITITGNNVSKNLHGIVIGESSNIRINKNNISSNNELGISIGYSSNQNITGNNISNNEVGIYISKTNNVDIIKNNLLNNGIFLSGSSLSHYTTHNIPINNKVNGKPLYYYKNCKNLEIKGIQIGQLLLTNCSNIKVEDLHLNSATNSIFIAYSQNIIINNNSISSNVRFGIFLQSSHNGIISGNDISNNYGGIFLLGSSNNKIFHNNIISNTVQASDNGNNLWNNSLHEGNYWSDYAGLDNGAGGRTVGDNIGDTNLPHLGLDNYPLIKKSGWFYTKKPLLTGPLNIVLDGNYKLSWNKDNRTIYYILEKDSDNTFNSPIVLYNGSWKVYYVNGENNGTYYYRLKAHNDYGDSEWSNIVKVIVDWLPPIPKNLKVSVYPHGNALNISWEPNLLDTEEYEIYYKFTNDWFYLDKIPHPVNTYNHTDLENYIEYSYKIAALDHRKYFLNFSNVVSAVPRDSIAPDAPTGLNATAVSGSEIELTWDTNVEADIEGYLIYMNDSYNGPSGNYYLIHRVLGSETSYTVTGLIEQISYYFKIKAFDEVPNNSSFSKVASATLPDLLRPSSPAGLHISNPTQNSLTISWNPNPEIDVIGYFLYQSLSLSDQFLSMNSVPISGGQYIDSDLEESTVYYYKIKAIDDFGLISEFSDVAFGKTLLGPHSPEINHPISDFSIPEDTYNITAINLFYWFKDINNDTLNFNCEGQNNIEVTIYKVNGSVVLKPKLNWNGQETLIFYASDGIYNISDDVVITITPVNDPPGPVEIINPKDGIKIKDNDNIIFEGICNDPDIPYGDVITFNWSSNISGYLGEGNYLKNIKLTNGNHLITLNVSDRSGRIATATVEITVIDDTESDKTDNEKQTTDNKLNLIITAGGIFILLMVLFLIFIRKRGKGSEKGKNQKEIQLQTDNIDNLNQMETVSQPKPKLSQPSNLEDVKPSAITSSTPLKQSEISDLKILETLPTTSKTHLPQESKSRPTLPLMISQDETARSSQDSSKENEKTKPSSGAKQAEERKLKS